MSRSQILVLIPLLSACVVDEPVAPPTVAWGVTSSDSLPLSRPSYPCEKADDCHDGSWCTVNLCISGKCAFLPKDDYQILCDDGNACTDDWCYAEARCVHTPVSGMPQCGDGHPCGMTYWCEVGECKAFGDALCDDFDPCTLDTCSLPFGCEHAPIDGCRR